MRYTIIALSVIFFGALVLAASEFGLHMKAMDTSLKCLKKKPPQGATCGSDADEVTTFMNETSAAQALAASFFKDLPSDQQADIASRFISLKEKINALAVAIQNNDDATRNTTIQEIDNLKEDSHDKYKDD